MKSTIIHGENQPVSRKKFIELIKEAKKGNLDIIRVDWKKNSEKDLRTLSMSQSLLSLGVCVAVENFFTGNKKAQEIIDELDLKNTIFLFWEDKQLTPATQKKLQSKFLILDFPIPQTIFNFLNSVTPKNAKNMIKLFEEARKTNPDEMLLVMLARHVRLLYWAKIEPTTMSMPDWMKKRFIAQARDFNKDQLLNLHGQLLDLDRKAKKSQLPENLGSSLEVLLATL